MNAKSLSEMSNGRFVRFRRTNVPIYIQETFKWEFRSPQNPGKVFFQIPTF